MSDLRELLPWLRQLSASEFVRLKKLLIPHLLRVSKLWSNSNITSKKSPQYQNIDLVSYNQSVDSANEQLENMAIFRTELVNLTPLIIIKQKCMFELKKNKKKHGPCSSWQFLLALRLMALCCYCCQNHPCTNCLFLFCSDERLCVVMAAKLAAHALTACCLSPKE